MMTKWVRLSVRYMKQQHPSWDNFELTTATTTAITSTATTRRPATIIKTTATTRRTTHCLNIPLVTARQINLPLFPGPFFLRFDCCQKILSTLINHRINLLPFLRQVFNAHVVSVQNLGWLFDIRDYTT